MASRIFASAITLRDCSETAFHATAYSITVDGGRYARLAGRRRHTAGPGLNLSLFRPSIVLFGFPFARARGARL
eukprot:6225385-Prymnesium_polylepis.1